MIRLAIADDHAVVLNGLQKIIAQDADITIIGTYNNGALLLEALQEQQPDVLMLDIQMPGMTGIELAAIIHKKYPAIKMIALTNVEVLPLVKKMMRNGCMGYLLKDVEPTILLDTIHKVQEGEQVIAERIKSGLISTMFSPDTAQMVSRREIEILQLIADEFTNPEIAEKLHISPHTVENHRNRMLQKLGVKNTAGLIKKAMEQGLIN
jgi:DNA-binding NarL/FixJ family response regulator